MRELENAIRRALVLSSGGVLTSDDFAFLKETRGPENQFADLGSLVEAETRSALAAEEDELYRVVIERVERPMIEAVLEHTGGNQIRAAGLLGINRNTLRKKISELGCEMPRRDRS